MVKSIPPLSPLAHQWFTNSPLGISADAYVRYLNERGYAAGTVKGYANCVAHFGKRSTNPILTA